MKRASFCGLTGEATHGPAFAVLHSPLPSARCRVWVGVWPAAPCLLLSGCGKVHEPAFALSTPAAETPELLCHELAEWPEDEHGETVQQEWLSCPRKAASEDTGLLSAWPRVGEEN